MHVTICPDRVYPRRLGYHDDVVDESDMRRGKATANAAFGSAPRAGRRFYLYPRVQMVMASVPQSAGNHGEAVNVIAEGRCN